MNISWSAGFVIYSFKGNLDWKITDYYYYLITEDYYYYSHEKYWNVNLLLLYCIFYNCLKLKIYIINPVVFSNTVQGAQFKWATIGTLLTMQLTIKFKWGTPPYFYLNLKHEIRFMKMLCNFPIMAANFKINYGNLCIL